MRYEKTKDGLYLPESLRAKGRFHYELIRASGEIEEWDEENTVVNQGLIALLNIGFASASVITNWYMALFINNYTPVITDTASSIVGNAGEFTSYSGGARPTYSPAAASGTPSISNTASQATFNITASATLMGSFVISSATPGSNSGTLWSAAQFSSARSVGNGDTLNLTYSTSFTSS